jgi:hypothetical protein
MQHGERRGPGTVAAWGAEMMELRSARGSRFLVVLVATLLVAATFAACSYVNARSIHFVGRPDFPPTDPATVEILHRPPMRPHEVLGQVVLHPEGDPSQAAIEEKLREQTAAMGGNAAVIVHDQLQRVGSVWTGGPWWGGGQIQPVMGEVISAIVVHFVTDREP